MQLIKNKFLKMKEAIIKIEKWASDRNFFCLKNGTNLEMQFYKGLEELGEMHSNLLRKRTPKDDIGDIFVVNCIMNKLSGYTPSNLLTKSKALVVKPKLWLSVNQGDIAYQIRQNIPVNKQYYLNICDCLNQIAKDNNLTLLECVEHSYNEIKDRKGKFINNVFVKESDLKNISYE